MSASIRILTSLFSPSNHKKKRRERKSIINLLKKKEKKSILISNILIILLALKIHSLSMTQIQVTIFFEGESNQEHSQWCLETMGLLIKNSLQKSQQSVKQCLVVWFELSATDANTTYCVI